MIIKEDHALIYTYSNKHCDLYNLVFRDKGSFTTKTIRPDQFNQIDLVKYVSVDIEAHFKGDGFVEGEIFVGSWYEVILKEIELSIDRFHVQCDRNSKNTFTIGVDGYSTIKVMPDVDGGHTIRIQIVDKNKEQSSLQGHFPANYDSTVILNNIYARILNKYNEIDFIQKQEANKNNLTEYFEYRLRDGSNRKW